MYCCLGLTVLMIACYLATLVYFLASGKDDFLLIGSFCQILGAFAMASTLGTYGLYLEKIDPEAKVGGVANDRV